MEMNKIEAIFQFLIGSFGLVINTTVLFSLNSCTTLSFFTLAIMKCQCMANLIGLVPILFYSPWSLFFSFDLTPGSIAMNAIGSLVVLSIYSQFALQALMAINRLCVFRFPHKLKRWFPEKRVKKIIASCMLYGACHGMAALFPCCNIAYVSSPGRWAINGTGSHIQQWIQFVGDMLTFPTMIICHTAVLLRLDKLRQQAQSSRLTRENFKIEIRIMVQFCIVAIMWLIYCGFFRLLQFVPSARERQETRLIVEFSRYLFLIIDPTLNLFFLTQLRQSIYIKMTCQNGEINRSESIQLIPSHAISSSRIRLGTVSTVVEETADVLL